MIRINLLGVPTRREAPPTVPPTAARQALFFVGGLVVAGAIAGFFGIYWGGQVKRLEVEFADQRREAERLKQIAQENQRHQRQLQQLKLRIDTIQTLQASKIGPTDFLTALGSAVNRLPDVYLLSVSPEGNRFALRGQADRVEAIASFIAALKQTPSFQDVQLRQYFQDNQHGRPSYKFNIDFAYKLPTAAPATPQAAAAGPQRPAGKPGM